MTREEILRLLDDQDAAMNRHDTRALAGMYAQDATLHDPSLAGRDVRGGDAIAEHIGGYMRVFADFRWERVSVEVDGNVGVEEWRVTGTHEGDMPGLPATHRKVSVEGCSVLRFEDDGLVHEDRTYWDEAGMLRQLGVLPEPATA